MRVLYLALLLAFGLGGLAPHLRGPAVADPDEGREELARLRAAAGAGRWEEVQSRVPALLRAYPRGPIAAEAAGLGSEAAWRLRRFEASLAYAERYLELAPEGARAERYALRRGETLFRLRRGPEARAALDALLRAHPSAPAEARARELLRRIDPPEVERRGDVVLDYAGKYVGDPRWAARVEEVIRALPGARRRVSARLGPGAGTEAPVRIRFRDTGEHPDGRTMVTAMELVGTQLRSAIVVRTERLLVGYDLETMLAHELTHAQQQTQLGERTDGSSTWAREGAAMWVAEQGARRLRTDVWGLAQSQDGGAAHPLLDGLRSPHRLRDYSEDWLAFAWIEATRGAPATRDLCARIGASPDVEGAYAAAAALPFPEAEARARAWAESRVREHLAGADAFLAARRLARERRHAEALAAFDALLALTPEHPFAPPARLHRAIALAHVRRFDEALAELTAIERSPWADVLAGEAVEERLKISAARHDLAGVEAAGSVFLRDFSFADPARLAAARALWSKAGGTPPPPDGSPGAPVEDEDS